MASLTIRNLDDRVETKTPPHASGQNGRSMEEEARRLLTAAVRTSTTKEAGLGTAIRRRFATLGGFSLEPLPRERMRKPPKFK